MLHVWWKTSKVIKSLEITDGKGNKKDKYTYSPDPSTEVDEDCKVLAETKFPATAYEGYFSYDADICLEWGEQKSILRTGEDKEEVLSNFIFYMPHNTGNMRPNSPMSMMIDSIRNMDIAILKIKLIIAKAAPDDYMIDISSLQDIDLGTGQDLEPIDIMEIHAQTGRLYYRSRDASGQVTNQVPVRPNLSPYSDKIRANVDWYNTELANIRDYLGVNEFRDGSATNPRTGFRFMQAQSQASNTATWFLYDAYLKMMGQLIRQIGIRIWDALNFGDVNAGYLKYLGKENIDFIKERKDITASSYDISFSMGMDESQMAALEENIQACLANQTLEMPDAYMLRRIEDPILAEKMLTFLYDKRRKEREAEAAQRSAQQAEQAANAGVAVEQAKQQSVQFQAEMEMAKEKSRGDNEQINLLIKGAMAILEESFKTGKPIPDQYAPLVDLALTSAGLKAQKSGGNTQKEIESEALAEQQGQLEQELTQAVNSGEMSEEEAMQVMQQGGV